jgi:hypothetical protein
MRRGIIIKIIIIVIFDPAQETKQGKSMRSTHFQNETHENLAGQVVF